MKKSGYKIFKQPSPYDQDLKPEDPDNELKPDNAKNEITNEDMSEREAFFALMAIKMMNLSQKYQRKLEDLHDIFYTVSCDWERLE